MVLRVELLRAEDVLRVVLLRAVVLRPVVFRAVVFLADVFLAVVFRAVVLRAAVFRAVVVFRRVVVFRADVLRAVVFFRPELVLRDEEEDDLEDDPDFVSPFSARCLLTVRAAISFARLVERPCFFSESLMCSYCRSRFELHASGMCRTSLRVCWAANACPKRARSIRG